MVAIDLNSDLGESFGAWSFGDDAAMLAIVTSANVACGFHAGDPTVLRTVCTQAVAHDVVIGAQVSYPDLVGFGRRFIDMAPDELRDAVLYQLGALDAFAKVAGTRISYLKPHGALYHAAAGERVLADAVVAAAVDYDPSLSIVGLPGSELLAAAEGAGLEGIAEAFADRAYLPDGRLVSRREAGAVITDPHTVAERATRFAVDNEVVAIDGSILRVAPRTLCVHGDTPGAAAIATAVRDDLAASGVAIEPFTA